MKVFLGGTCNNSKWRNQVIPLLKIDYFNPVVEDWTPEDQQEEIKQRETCDYILYVITPLMTGVYSIAEVVDDSNKRPDKTLFCFITIDENKMFTVSQIKSLNAVKSLVEKNGVKTFGHYKDVTKFLNSKSKNE